MKELSVEEKAKAYDEALKYAMIYYKDGNEDMKMMMKTCFPVLVEESEDERIRKAIKKALQIKCDGSKIISDEPVTLEEAIAWLEKQGEKEKFIKKELGYIKGYRELAIKRLNEIEKQGEQKPAFEMITPEESLGIDSDTYNKIVDECIYGEQNPAWSEDDEVKINRIVACLENLNVADNDILLKDVDWLKSIKGRVQPKQEWSEDDAKALNRISTILVDASEVKNWWKEYRLIERDEMIRLTDFLKSLKDRYTWKPSDEQMEALDDAIAICSERDYETECRLDNLRQDLKKLKQ